MNIKEEEENLYYLKKNKLDKTLPELIKKLKNKRIVVYGAGTLFNLIKKHYDISGLNIVGIADRKFESSNCEYFDNYKIFKLKEITKDDIDCILISVKFYTSILEELYDRYKSSKITVLPLVKKSLWTLLKEV